MNFNPSLTRIRTKLAEAARSDPGFRVFGADVHRYRMHAPISRQQVTDFEKGHGIVLPEAYASFLTSLGNGGPGHFGAAGPCHGMYALGEFGYMPTPSESLAAP